MSTNSGPLFKWTDIWIMMQYLNNESENTNIDKWLEMAKTSLMPKHCISINTYVLIRCSILLVNYLLLSGLCPIHVYIKPYSLNVSTLNCLGFFFFFAIRYCLFHYSNCLSANWLMQIKQVTDVPHCSKFCDTTPL